MMALSPVLLIGAWIDQKMVARRTFKQQKKQFDASMLRLQEKLEGERILERGARHVEAPSLAECRTAIEQVSPLLWTRRPEHAEFLAVRLGVGRSASRNEVVLPQGNETKPEFLDQLEGLRTEFAELDDVLEIMASHGLKRGENGLQVVMMCEVPVNYLLADEFLDRVDGFSIGSNDMTQLILGVDRDSGLVAHDFDERNPAVLKVLASVIETCRRRGKYVGICGQGPSDHPDLASWLVEQGIESMSLTPDTVVQTWLSLTGAQ